MLESSKEERFRYVNLKYSLAQSNVNIKHSTAQNLLTENIHKLI